MTQSTSMPFPLRQVSSTFGYVPVPGVQMNVLSGVTFRTRSLNETVTGSPFAAGNVNAATGASESVPGIWTGANEPPSYQSRSTRPPIPGTEPLLVYCQNVHPLPFQSSAGSRGVATPQCATHRTVYPASATAVVS